MMRGGTINKGWTGNRDLARCRRYPLNLQGVASMPIEWAIILVVAISDAILLAETSFRLEASAELRILAGLIVLAVVLVICRQWKSFPRTTDRLAHLTRTVLALVLFTNAVSILSFILTGILPLPRCDEALATADRALGLNWLDMYHWLTRHPASRPARARHTIALARRC
jgi:ethanolamine transporter EutH